jgi:predicted O-methyltransferase YrrM
MSNFTIGLDETLRRYLVEHSVRETEVMARLRAETAEMPHAVMQITPEQGQFMALLIEILGARRALEVGTFTGYSALAVARALPPDGRLVACDVSEEYAAVARRYWADAGIADRIDLRLGPALETLKGLLEDGAADSFDFCFIDADKSNYDGYYELALKLVRPGGLVAIDNVLWSGAVADPDDHSDDTRAIRALNDKVYRDDRVSVSMLPIGDGLTLARRR